jgi:hypothetical protein
MSPTGCVLLSKTRQLLVRKSDYDKRIYYEPLVHYVREYLLPGRIRSHLHGSEGRRAT